MIKRFDPLLLRENAGLIQRTPHVDFSVFGAAPLQIYIENKDSKYLDMGKWSADRQWENPRPDGLPAGGRMGVLRPCGLLPCAVIRAHFHRRWGASEWPTGPKAGLRHSGPERRYHRGNMNPDSSRRSFLRVGLTLPAVGLAGPRPGAAFQAPASQTPSSIPYRTLGKTGLKVCPVGVGVGLTPDPSVFARAVDLGINYFDTAHDSANGNSERMLTVGLKGVPRDKVIVSTKTPARTRGVFITDLEDSLKNLATDRIDIWHLHAKSKPEEVPDELLEAANAAKKQGKIRFFGVSTHDVELMADHFLKAGNIDVVAFPYNFTMGTGREAVIGRLSKAGIGLTAIKVMAANGGVLPGSGRGPGGGGMQARGGGMPPRPAAIKNPLPALKWVLRNPMVAVAIPGVRDVEMLEMNLRALGEKFTAEDEKLLSARSEEIRPYYCRMCYSCRGQCPKGMPIPDQLRILAYADFYGDFPLAQRSFSALPKEVQALRCGDCSECPVRCPNGVKVAERLIRAQELLA